MPGAGTHPPPDDLRSVAGFPLLRLVGEGGMSTVYLSYDVAAGRPVAVKVLADHLAGQQEFVQRFHREARNSQQLGHPNLVRGYAAGQDPATGKHYLVLEYVDGPCAQTALARVGRLPVGVAVRVGIDVATALRFLHGRDFVHRDVKPDNILLPPGGPAKLADLGLTKRISDDGHLTAVSQGVGTSYYMPYEQAMNASLVDGRSDIFALGATLYHLLTGQVPFPGSSHEEVIRGKEHGRFRPVRSVAPEVPPVLAAVIARTLSRDPRARFQDAAALADTLEATGLAAAIPAFPAATAGRPAAATADAPTRADLPVGPPTPDFGPRPGGFPAGAGAGPAVAWVVGPAVLGLAVTAGVYGLWPGVAPPAPGPAVAPSPTTPASAPRTTPRRPIAKAGGGLSPPDGQTVGQDPPPATKTRTN